MPQRVFVEVNERGRPVVLTRQRHDGMSGMVDDRSPHAVMPLCREGVAVESVGEEWRVYDEWWRQPIVRRYVEVILKGGKHLVLYEDQVTGEWFEQTP